MARRPAIVELARRLPDRLTLADIGVRWGFEPRWNALAPAARLIGFDADDDECRVLRGRHADLPEAIFAPVALSDRAGTHTLHITQEPAASSLLEPDPGVLRSRRGMKAMRPARTTQIETETLAGWAGRSGVDRLDVLKLDVQGAELAVLRGAGALLDGVRALDLEVEFNPIYSGQPLFSEIDAFLREQGFVLWRLGELTHCRLPGSDGGGEAVETIRFADGLLRYRVGSGQLTWGRARYVRSDMADPPAPRTFEAEVVDACAAWSLQLDDVAQAVLRRAASLDPAVSGALAELSRARRPRALLRYDLPGAARRWTRVHALGLRGWDDERIAREAGLTRSNVRSLRRLGPARFGLSSTALAALRRR